MRYTYPPADLQAAATDHDYNNIPLLENWVDSSLKVKSNDIKEIEISTRNQARSQLWFQHRKWRITASRFGEVCKATHRRNMEKLCHSLVSAKAFHSPATSHGNQYEKKAIECFEKEYQLKVKPCGLFVPVDMPYIGATPDGVIDDDHIVEVKCPYVGRNEIIQPGNNFSFIKYNEKKEMVLNKIHNYYLQIQGQLHTSQRKCCFLIVYTFKDLFVQKINYDSEYCQNSLMLKLELFYKKYHRKYIAKLL